MRITVGSNQFRHALRGVSRILKKSELTKSLAFTIVDNRQLVLTVQADVIFQCYLEILHKDNSLINTTITVRYIPLDSLLSAAEEETTVDWTDFGITIENSGVHCFMPLSESIVSLYKLPSLQYRVFERYYDSDKFLSSTGQLDKIFLMQASTLMFDNHTGKRYPTVWLRSVESELRTIYPPEFCSYISFLSPNEYAEHDGKYYFRSMQENLILPKIDCAQDTLFDDLFNDMEKIGTVQPGTLRHIEDMLAQVKDTMITVGLAPYGISLEAITETVELRLPVDNIFFKFQMQSNLFKAILNCISSSVLDIYRKENLLCLTQQGLGDILIRLTS